MYMYKNFKKKQKNLKLTYLYKNYFNSFFYKVKKKIINEDKINKNVIKFNFNNKKNNSVSEIYKKINQIKWKKIKIKWFIKYLIFKKYRLLLKLFLHFFKLFKNKYINNIFINFFKYYKFINLRVQTKNLIFNNFNLNNINKEFNIINNLAINKKIINNFFIKRFCFYVLKTKYFMNMYNFQNIINDSNLRVKFPFWKKKIHIFTKIFLKYNSKVLSKKKKLLYNWGFNKKIFFIQKRINFGLFYYSFWEKKLKKKTIFWKVNYRKKKNKKFINFLFLRKKLKKLNKLSTKYFKFYNKFNKFNFLLKFSKNVIKLLFSKSRYILKNTTCSNIKYKRILHWKLTRRRSYNRIFFNYKRYFFNYRIKKRVYILCKNYNINFFLLVKNKKIKKYNFRKFFELKVKRFLYNYRNLSRIKFLYNKSKFKKKLRFKYKFWLKKYKLYFKFFKTQSYKKKLLNWKYKLNFYRFKKLIYTKNKFKKKKRKSYKKIKKLQKVKLFSLHNYKCINYVNKLDLTQGFFKNLSHSNKRRLLNLLNLFILKKKKNVWKIRSFNQLIFQNNFFFFKKNRFKVWKWRNFVSTQFKKQKKKTLLKVLFYKLDLLYKKKKKKILIYKKNKNNFFIKNKKYIINKFNNFIYFKNILKLLKVKIKRFKKMLNTTLNFNNNNNIFLDKKSIFIYLDKQLKFNTSAFVFLNFLRFFNKLNKIELRIILYLKQINLVYTKKLSVVEKFQKIRLNNFLVNFNLKFKKPIYRYFNIINEEIQDEKEFAEKENETNLLKYKKKISSYFLNSNDLLNFYNDNTRFKFFFNKNFIFSKQNLYFLHEYNLEFEEEVEFLSTTLIYFLVNQNYNYNFLYLNEICENFFFCFWGKVFSLDWIEELEVDLINLEEEENIYIINYNFELLEKL